MAYAVYHLRPDARISASNWSGTSASVSDNSSTTYAYPTSVFQPCSAQYSLGTATIAGLGTTTFIYGVRPVGVFGSSSALGSIGLALAGGTYASNYIGTTYATASVSNVARAADGVTTITTSAAHSLAVNDYVLITGNTGHPWINGTWLVASVGSTTTFTFQHPETSAITSAASATGNTYRVNVVGGMQYTSGSANWTQALVDDLKINCDGARDETTSGTEPRLYEIWGEVTVYDYPSISITSIGDDTSSASWNPTNSATPIVTWTYSQTQNAPQTGVVMKLFSTTTATPETSTPLWSSTILDGSTSTQITYSMVSGTAYYLYYKVASGGGGALNYGAWSSAVTITPSLTVPTIPTIGSVTYSTTTEKVTIPLSGGAAFAGGTQTWQLQRSDDGGTTYYDVRGCSSFNLTAASTAPSAITVYDYEAKRNVTARYRVRAKSGLVSSAWSSASTVSISSTSQWALIAFDSDAGAAAGTLTKTYVGAPVLNESSVDIVESTGVFRPLGSTKSVVIHGVLTGQDGKYRFSVNTVANRDSLLAVVNSQSTIMVSSPLNEIKYIRIVSRNFTLQGTITNPQYVFDIQYIEVASGLSS